MKHEEAYTITPLGLLTIHLGEDKAKKVHDDIELYCRRNGCGIAVDDNKLRFVKLTKVSDE